MINIIKGNIFNTKCQTIVNTVNCVGIMGAGIAYECKLRYPKMFERYTQLCDGKQIQIGKLWLYHGTDKWILNFPTKIHWKYNSKVEYLQMGLQKFNDTYNLKGITSIAFPLLGASNGGIPENISLNIMMEYLSKVDINVEIYEYDPMALDETYLSFKNVLNSIPENEFAKLSGLRIDFVKKLKIATMREDICSMNRLLTIKGISDITLEKSFHFIMNYKSNEGQLKLL